MQAAVAAAMRTEPAQYIGRVTGVSGYSTQVELPRANLPGKGDTSFTERWTNPNMTRPLLEEAAARWRGTARKS
jgi:hypothetical protein